MIDVGPEYYREMTCILEGEPAAMWALLAGFISNKCPAIKDKLREDTERRFKVNIEFLYHCVAVEYRYNREDIWIGDLVCSHRLLTGKSNDILENTVSGLIEKGSRHATIFDVVSHKLDMINSKLDFILAGGLK